MKSVARTISKPFEWVGQKTAKLVTKPVEWLGQKTAEVIGGIGGLLTPKMPEIPAWTYTPPEAPAEPAGPQAPAEPAGPGASASESSEAQAERRRVLLRRKKTRTLLTGAQGVTEDAGVVKKKLLGE
jgi:hypothetical protein